jgi:UPF0716 protein FxsA
LIRLAIGLLLIILPVAELAVLIKTGQMIGVWPTIALVIGMGLVGLLVLSQQSYTAFNQTLQAMSEGRPPLTPVLDGLFLMLAGTLLLLPGLISDVAALVLLIPPLRKAIAGWTVRRILASPYVHFESEFDAGQGSSGTRPRSGPSGDGPIIEGEFERMDERPPPRGPDDRKRLT